jgi:5-methylcytosine-specific restriction endonuclease McrA
VISSRRALVLIIEGKATIVEEHPELVVRSPRQTFPVPVMIALKMYIKGRRVFKTPALLTQRNLFIRDAHTCQYCGRDKTRLKKTEFLTRDHVIPQSRGGKDVWTNVVTCCSTCNNNKTDYLLKETEFKLAKAPVVPTIFEIWTKTHSKRFRVRDGLIQ